jgi:hypothetical protein
MRISKDKSITRETSFKADKNIDSELDDTEAKFVFVYIYILRGEHYH